MAKDEDARIDKENSIIDTFNENSLSVDFLEEDYVPYESNFESIPSVVTSASGERLLTGLKENSPLIDDKSSSSSDFSPLQISPRSSIRSISEEESYIVRTDETTSEGGFRNFSDNLKGFFRFFLDRTDNEQFSKKFVRFAIRDIEKSENDYENDLIQSSEEEIFFNSIPRPEEFIIDFTSSSNLAWNGANSFDFHVLDQFGNKLSLEDIKITNIDSFSNEFYGGLNNANQHFYELNGERNIKVNFRALDATEAGSITEAITFTVTLSNGATFTKTQSITFDGYDFNDLTPMAGATSGDDTLAGTSAIDRIDSGAGADDISAGDGADYINAGNGTDTVSGGDGNDYIDGHGQDDSLMGGNGDDYITGDHGNDTIDGENGADILYGDIGNDEISGGSGADYIMGGTGQDTADGGAGNDTITFSNEVSYGGNGDDTFHYDTSATGSVSSHGNQNGETNSASYTDRVYLQGVTGNQSTQVIDTGSNNYTISFGGTTVTLNTVNSFSVEDGRIIFNNPDASGILTNNTTNATMNFSGMEEIYWDTPDSGETFVIEEVATTLVATDIVTSHDSSARDRRVAQNINLEVQDQFGEAMEIDYFRFTQNTIDNFSVGNNASNGYFDGASFRYFDVHGSTNYVLHTSYGLNADATLNVDLNLEITLTDGQTISSTESATFNVLSQATIQLSGDTYYNGTSSGDNFTGDSNDSSANEWFQSGNGDDTIYGDDGHDFLSGGNDRDALYGGAGDDRVSVGAGTLQTASGGDGNDVLVGRDQGTNFLWGDAGDDILDPGTNDVAYGGSGNDIFTVQDSSQYGDDGNDLFIWGSDFTVTAHGNSDGESTNANWTDRILLYERSGGSTISVTETAPDSDVWNLTLGAETFTLSTSQDFTVTDGKIVFGTEASGTITGTAGSGTMTFSGMEEIYWWDSSYV